MISLACMTDTEIDEFSDRRKYCGYVGFRHHEKSNRWMVRSSTNEKQKLYATFPFIPCKDVIPRRSHRSDIVRVQLIPGTQEAIVIHKLPVAVPYRDEKRRLLIHKFALSTDKSFQPPMQLICDIEFGCSTGIDVTFDTKNKWMVVREPDYGIHEFLLVVSMEKDTRFKPVVVNDSVAWVTTGLRTNNYAQFCNVKDKCFVMFRFFGRIRTSAGIDDNKAVFSLFELSQCDTKMKELIRISPDKLTRPVHRKSEWLLRPYTPRMPAWLVKLIKTTSYLRYFFPKEIVFKIQKTLIDMEWVQNVHLDTYRKTYSDTTTRLTASGSYYKLRTVQDPAVIVLE